MLLHKSSTRPAVSLYPVVGALYRPYVGPLPTSPFYWMNPRKVHIPVPIAEAQAPNYIWNGGSHFHSCFELGLVPAQSIDGLSELQDPKIKGGISPPNTPHQGRSGLKCIYDATLDRRRKIHWERAETESTLQKQLLQRLLRLIHSGDDDIRKRLKDDIPIRMLVQRLGMDTPEHAATSSSADTPGSWASAHAEKTSRHEFAEDVSQKEELIRRQGIFPEGVHDFATRAGPSTAWADPRSEESDPRDKFRIFCSRTHDTPSVEFVSIFGDSSFLSPEIRASQVLTLQQQQQTLNLDIPEYLIQPMLFEGERCPIAAVYTDFRDYGRRQLASGFPVEFVLGPPQVDLTLYFRNRRAEDPHTPVTWACEYMRLLKNFDTYVALAWIFTYTHFMRWTIAPSAATYALLPEAMRPTPLQRLVRHHPGVDLPIFPEMRDGLVQDMRDYIVAIQTLGCSVNWEYGLAGAIDTDPETGNMTLSDRFATHICDLSHWSISQRFADVFPEMRGYYQVVGQDTIPASKVDVEEFLGQRAQRRPETD
ncbi:hypothetical protein AYO20_10469 [Fonsecaea nubica]|uniref:Uncharacterized protein n=1 Tax=Fonsecaea nubica TaxID=856822 RepID=A0A178C8P8_9EURO|nr:hypothetical protein AYO20_10469 [Fonsecaea nubica]OAL25435.1 hypothetical protein AYO20_10469 [Fonsecaea nubica]